MPQSFDEAFPGGFEECVSTLGQEPSVDNPEKLCGWLQEHGFEAIENADPDSILAGLQVEYVSVVDEPAQDSEWLLAKSADADEANWTPGQNRLGDTRELLLRKQDEEDMDEDEDEDSEDDEEDSTPERKVWAAVLVPGRADAHGDLIPEPEIESAAHDYMKHYRKVDADHSLFEGEGTPIESYIIRNGPEEFETPDGGSVEYPEGTWIMGVELGADAWKRVQSGDLTGFSIYGGAASLDPAALLTEKQRDALRRHSPDADAAAKSAGESQPVPPRVELGTRRVSLQMGDGRQDLLKQLGADALANLAEALRAYFDENPNSTVTDTDMAEMFEWAADAELDAMDDEVEVGGVVIPIRPPEDSDEDEEVEEESDEDDEDEEDDEEQEKNESPEDEETENTDANADTDMDDELKDTLGEIRDTTESIAKSVNEHGDRLDSLREDLDETRKAVGLTEEEEADADGSPENDPDGNEADGEAEKSDGDAASEIQSLREDLAEAGLLEKSADGEDEDDEEDVERKVSKSGTGPDDVEKDSGKISTSAEGITAAGRVN